jgi:3-oxoacyl-[acyl-carrier-protein] synthase II
MAACATGLWAIAQGADLIRSGQCQRVIAGAVEVPITPLTLAGFFKMGALAARGAYPFDERRQGFVLAEGGAVLVLERSDLAASRDVKIYGQVLGFGATVDAYHVSSPNPDRGVAMAAVRECLRHSDRSVQDIDYVHAHGTATRLNDQAEARLLQALFPQGVPVSSTKGATGHTLGASGALGAAFSLLALHQGVLPPCVGLGQPAFDLDLVTTARSRPVDTALCFSFGFGGQNAALALAAYSPSN